MAYEGKYFENRDFYEWGLDYEVEKISEKFGSFISNMEYYRKIFSDGQENFRINYNNLEINEKNIVDIFLENADSKDMEKISELYQNGENVEEFYSWFDVVISNLQQDGKDFETGFPFLIAKDRIDVFELHNKMCFINLYTLVDEFMSEYIVAIAVYNKKFVEKLRVRLTHEDIRKTKADEDLRQLIILTALKEDKTFSGLKEKYKKIKNFFKHNDNRYLEEIELFQYERNVLIHNGGVFIKKDLEKSNNVLIKSILGNQKMYVDLSNKKIEESISVINSLIGTITKMTYDYYERSK